MLGLHALNAIFGAVSLNDPVTPSSTKAYVKALTDQGVALFWTKPNSKTPWDLRTPKQIKDQEASWEAADPATRPRSKKSLSGVHMATDKPTIVNNWYARALKANGVDIKTQDSAPVDIVPNPAVNLGLSRCVVVDCDTAEELQAFRTWAAERSGDPRWNYATPTVSTPGVVDDNGEWKHKDGGHFWFTLPGFGLSSKKREDRAAKREKRRAQAFPGSPNGGLSAEDQAEEEADKGLDMVHLPGSKRVNVGNSSFTVMIHSHYVLAPGSHRPEGWYRVQGPAMDIPKFLMDAIDDWRMAGIETTNERARKMARAGLPDEAVTQLQEWYEDTPWSDILVPHGWDQTGTDSCGCTIWGRPGNRSSNKSATAHQPGCALENYVDSMDPPMVFWTDNPGPEIEAKLAEVGGQTLSKLQVYSAFEAEGRDSDALREVISPDTLGPTDYIREEAPGFAVVSNVDDPDAVALSGGDVDGEALSASISPTTGAQPAPAPVHTEPAPSPQQPSEMTSGSSGTAPGTSAPQQPSGLSDGGSGVALAAASPASTSTSLPFPGVANSVPFPGVGAPASPSDDDDFTDDDGETLAFVPKTTGTKPRLFRTADRGDHIPAFFSLDTIDLPPVSFLVDGWIQHHAVSAVVGPSNAGKSAVLIDMLCAIAGDDGHQFGFWKGVPCHHEKVIYIAGEGASGVRQRVLAWQHAHGTKVTDRFHMTAEGFKMGSSEAAWAHLSDQITAGGYGVVVIDTLATMMTGLEENSADDMGATMSALQQLCNETGAAIILVHHTTKNSETFSPRGSSALTGALASQILVRKQEMEELSPEHADELDRKRIIPIEVSVTKQKDARFPDARNLTLVGYDLEDVPGIVSYDEFGTGTSATTVLVGWADGDLAGNRVGVAEAPERRKTHSEPMPVMELARRVILRLVSVSSGPMEGKGEAWNTLAQLRDYIYANHLSAINIGRTEATQQINRAIQICQAANAIVLDGNRARLSVDRVTIKDSEATKERLLARLEASKVGEEES